MPALPFTNTTEMALGAKAARAPKVVGGVVGGPDLVCVP